MADEHKSMLYRLRPLTERLPAVKRPEGHVHFRTKIMWVILMLVFYLFLILMQLLTRRFLKAAPWTTLALLLAAACGYAMKLGFITHDLF